MNKQKLGSIKNDTVLQGAKWLRENLCSEYVRGMLHCCSTASWPRAWQTLHYSCFPKCPLT